MSEATHLLSQLAARTEAILANDPDPREAMREIAQEAESAGLIDATGSVRMTSPMVFVRDLLLDNPEAQEWANAKLGEIRPLQIKDKADLLDALSPR
jgi:hypothetical protein